MTQERQVLQSELADLRFELGDAQERQALLAERQTQPLHLDPDMDLVGDEDGNIIGSMEPEKDMGLVSEDIERLTQRNLPVSARNLIMMQKENQALRDRIKEVRIILNKQVNDLQDDLKMTKASNENELTRMKIQYGKDLQVLENDYKSSSALVRQQVR